MHYILLNVIFGKIGWIDISTLLGIIAIIVYIWRIAKSNVTKKEMEAELTKKADKALTNEKLKNITDKLAEHEKLNNFQFESIKEHLEEIGATQENSDKKIDRLIEKLI